MIIVDGHCDTITKIMETKESLNNNTCHTDLNRMSGYDGFVQFYAAFIEPHYGGAYALKRAIEIIDAFYLEQEKHSQKLAICTSSKDIENALLDNKIAGILSIEGGEALNGDLSALRMFYKLGVRSLCLTWNNRNEIADGQGEDITGGGLSNFGRSVVSEMNSIGMLIDVSHIAERGFWDVLEQTTSPIIASHSNARAICNHKRNLTDDQIIALAKNKGVMGINFYPPFLTKSKTAALTDIINHIEHIVGLVGCEYIGFGADFDGIATTPCDVLGVEDVEKVINTLAALNYSDSDIKKIAGENFLRIIKTVCG
jgi:membrane dipeptidase